MKKQILSATGPPLFIETANATIFEFKIAPTSNSYNSKSFQPILVFFFLT